MANKTIYVSDSDRELFDRAAELGGGLSPAISEALADWVAKKEAEADEFSTVSVQVSSEGVSKEKRFQGKFLTKVTAKSDGHHYVYTVYTTKKGQYAVHIAPASGFAGITAELQHLVGESGEWLQSVSRGAQGLKDKAAEKNPFEGFALPFSGPQTSSLRVFATPDSLVGELPDDVRKAIIDAEKQPLVEELDI
ncbi:EXLDI protein [Sediminivirga luteola]|uniref:Uncharacterized protein n=1 Tax=Sediminivirga luteola TaxID=1774748 RepID=A0A8J2TY73_9MICO|nr:EXLDI protein [Sediminivirga luteola]MCI2265778.1 EXLDI protein [Sediminivirga luteola]GGA14685.1 hypothetical protein GCM10011333_17050 [Sediminivirga luteola]